MGHLDPALHGTLRQRVALMAGDSGAECGHCLSTGAVITARSRASTPNGLMYVAAIKSVVSIIRPLSAPACGGPGSAGRCPSPTDRPRKSRAPDCHKYP